MAGVNSGVEMMSCQGHAPAAKGLQGSGLLGQWEPWPLQKLSHPTVSSHLLLQTEAGCSALLPRGRRRAATPVPSRERTWTAGSCGLVEAPASSRWSFPRRPAPVTEAGDPKEGLSPPRARAASGEARSDRAAARVAVGKGW